MANSGKNKRRRLEVKDEIHNVILSVDSQEEIDTLNFLEECVQLSVIQDFEYQPKSFELFEPVTYVNVEGKSRTLFQGHKYTADFKLSFAPSAYAALAKEFKVPRDALSCQKYDVYIDSKGTFNKTERSFSYNQKWTWQKYGIYVYKLVPKMFFAKFGVPLKSWYTRKTKKQRTIFKGMKSIEEMMNNKKH